MAKRKLKRTLKQQKQWNAGSRQKRKAYVSHLARIRALLKTSPVRVEVKLIRSIIGASPLQRGTVKALGLGKISSYTVQDFTATLHGMIKTVLHLVDVKEVQ